eukprot:sb/3470446/
MHEAYQTESSIELLVDENYKELLVQVEAEILKGGVSKDGKTVTPYSSISPILKDMSIVESNSDSGSDMESSTAGTAPDKYLTFDLDHDALRKPFVAKEPEYVEFHADKEATLSNSDHHYEKPSVVRVNAVKIRLCTDKEFFEVDRSELGSNYEELLQVLCSELEINRGDIYCVRKLPDIIIRNNKDIARILPGHRLEVEVLNKDF